MRYNCYVRNIFCKSRKSGACVKIAFVYSECGCRKLLEIVTPLWLLVKNYLKFNPAAACCSAHCTGQRNLVLPVLSSIINITRTQVVCYHDHNLHCYLRHIFSCFTTSPTCFTSIGLMIRVVANFKYKHCQCNNLCKVQTPPQKYQSVIGVLCTLSYLQITFRDFS